MQENESALICEIEELSSSGVYSRNAAYRLVRDKVSAYMQEIVRHKFRRVSQDFLYSPTFNTFVDHAFKNTVQLIFWKLLQSVYTSRKAFETHKVLDIVRRALKNHREAMHPKDGQTLHRLHDLFVIPVYESGHASLTKLYSQYLPLPPLNVFRNIVPQIILDHSQALAKTMHKYKDALKSKAFEAVVLSLQRNFRVKRRFREEIARIRESDVFKALYPEPVADSIVLNEIQKASQPYRPRECSAELADRIMNAAKSVKLFVSIHHFTSEFYITQILDDALYGRRTLRQKYISFKPAALGSFDAHHGGDANVICFGLNRVDPSSYQDDLFCITMKASFLGKNPCRFYKTRDLGFEDDTVRSVSLGGRHLRFCHTGARDAKNPGLTNFCLYGDDVDRTVIGYSRVPNYEQISYNLEGIHEVLALNFFRHLDNLRRDNNEGAKNSDVIDSIYRDITQLTDAELIAFLHDLGRDASDTAEYNFYGAYKIDFDAVSQFYSAATSYNLDMEGFISSLNQGGTHILAEAIKNLPGLFKSHRFLDFLCEKVNSPDPRTVLSNLRMDCDSRLPFWLRQHHEARVLESKGHEREEVFAPEEAEKLCKSMRS